MHGIDLADVGDNDDVPVVCSHSTRWSALQWIGLCLYVDVGIIMALEIGTNMRHV